MQVADAIVVGGGPAGSTCAWKLGNAGLDVLVLDRAEFPRPKLCAGWVTPEALADLEFDASDYPYGFMTFDELRLHWRGVSASQRCTQHSIRRVEFDDYLLRRSGARVLQHQVRSVRRRGRDYEIDGQYRCRYLIGAAGTRCPVYRNLFHLHSPRNGGLQTATLEQEFAYDWQDARCHLWFYADGLPGYAWYVPKANGYVNVGLGGMADAMKRRGRPIQDYWLAFVERLDRLGLVGFDGYRPKGYSYYLRGSVRSLRSNNAFLVGDSAGLATRDLCEGIGPAVRSGLLAASAIVTGEEYRLDTVAPRSGSGFVARLLERSFTADERAEEPGIAEAG